MARTQPTHAGTQACQNCTGKHEENRRGTSTPHVPTYLRTYRRTHVLTYMHTKVNGQKEPPERLASAVAISIQGGPPQDDIPNSLGDWPQLWLLQIRKVPKNDMHKLAWRKTSHNQEMLQDCYTVNLLNCAIQSPRDLATGLGCGYSSSGTYVLTYSWATGFGRGYSISGRSPRTSFLLKLAWRKTSHNQKMLYVGLLHCESPELFHTEPSRFVSEVGAGEAGLASSADHASLAGMANMAGQAGQAGKAGEADLAGLADQAGQVCMAGPVDLAGLAWPGWPAPLASKADLAGQASQADQAGQAGRRTYLRTYVLTVRSSVLTYLPLANSVSQLALAPTIAKYEKGLDGATKDPLTNLQLLPIRCSGNLGVTRICCCTKKECPYDWLRHGDCHFATGFGTADAGGWLVGGHGSCQLGGPPLHD